MTKEDETNNVPRGTSEKAVAVTGVDERARAVLPDVETFIAIYSDAARSLPPTCAVSEIRYVKMLAAEYPSDPMIMEWTNEWSQLPWLTGRRPQYGDFIARKAADWVRAQGRVPPVVITDAMQVAGASAIRFETTVINKLWTANAVYRAMEQAHLQETIPNSNQDRSGGK